LGPSGLSFVNLTNADLSGSDLTNVNLSHANLSHANLSNANLSNTNLTNVDLTGTTLTYADLSGADLTGAKVSYTDWNDFVTNSGASNLDSQYQNTITFAGPAPVPEPSTFGLIGIGALGVAFAARRRKAKVA
jgi:uncharacterized protein YjbI with pentapeptide repeats